MVGGKGSIGSRYAAIMKYHKIPFVIYDVDTPNVDLFSFDKYIIATPTETHSYFLTELAGARILCEKPVSKNPNEIPKNDHIYMVNNYQYVARLMNEQPPYFISYDYYRTGKDGLYWDCCQLLYMDPEAKLSKESPKWNVEIGGRMVPYRTLEESYIRMIKDFNDGKYGMLWDMDQAREMTEIVLRRSANANSIGHSSTK